MMNDCNTLFLAQGIMTHSSDIQSEDSEKQNLRMTPGARQLQHAADKGSIPQGAVRMQKQQVAEVMNRVITSWKPEKEMYGHFNFSLHLNMCLVTNQILQIIAYCNYGSSCFILCSRFSYL